MASIQKRGNSYRITVSCGYDLEGKQIRTSTTFTPAPGLTARQIEKEVQRQAILFEEQVKTGTVAVNGNIRLKAFTDIFLDDYARPYLKANTVRNYERDIDRINAALGHIRLGDLKAAHINRFYASLMQGWKQPAERREAVQRNHSSHQPHLFSRTRQGRKVGVYPI